MFSGVVQWERRNRHLQVEYQLNAAVRAVALDAREMPHLGCDWSPPESPAIRTPWVPEGPAGRVADKSLVSLGYRRFLTDCGQCVSLIDKRTSSAGQ